MVSSLSWQALRVVIDDINESGGGAGGRRRSWLRDVSSWLVTKTCVVA